MFGILRNETRGLLKETFVVVAEGLILSTMVSYSSSQDGTSIVGISSSLKFTIGVCKSVNVFKIPAEPAATPLDDSSSFSTLRFFNISTWSSVAKTCDTNPLKCIGTIFLISESEVNLVKSGPVS
mmetsp:Transcript_23893/g.49787  ORF Transcript_23893/g.49787 Transcript_23893/m.49787 type:complete len:125 (+) Transcript_23893:753-1127(+)